MGNGLLVWMDLEMSGLDPERERILEIATVITDGNLELIASGPELVVHQKQELLDAMDAWNKEHHTKSGLVERVQKSDVAEVQAEKQTLEFLQAYCPPRAVPLAGSSIHQDRRFLQKYMPQLESYLHYRNVDVSTVKELVRRWYPKVLASRPKKENKHRAVDDIKESIEELREYRTRVFRDKVEVPQFSQ